MPYASARSFEPMISAVLRRKLRLGLLKDSAGMADPLPAHGVRRRPPGAMEGCEKPGRVAICIASYRRPQGLHALLGALDAQRFEGARPEIVLIVADNDATCSARGICEDARRWLSLPLRYVVEPRKGIPFARNATVREAGDADWLAFVDDAGIPDPHWLAPLLRVQGETGADVVTGPVRTRFEQEPPAWVLEGDFFSTPRHATGASLDSACTNNALLRARALDGERELFDPRFRYGVGEDTLLFSRLAARGARIVWAEEAVVHESVPAARVGVRWLVRRGFAVGTAMTHITRCRRGAAWAGLEALAHAGGCVLRALPLLLMPARARRVRGLQLLGMAVGRLAGVAGVTCWTAPRSRSAWRYASRATAGRRGCTRCSARSTASA